MEKKIIELIKEENSGFQCIICCDTEATTKVRINRLKYDETMNAFHVCDKCVSRMQKDIEVCK